jgi:hypothetical protein
MRTVGDTVQERSWESLVQAMVEESGATPVSTIQHEEDYLDEDQADRVEGWIRDLVIDRKRAQQARPMQDTAPQSTRKRPRTGETIGEDAIV